MFLFDAHCDTITTIMEKKNGLFSNDGHIDLSRSLSFDAYTQIFAIWLDPIYYNNAKEQTLKSIDFFHEQISLNKDLISFITNGHQLKNSNRRLNAILSLEGGEAISRLDDIDLFYNLGVRLLTLTWNNNNKIASSIADNSDLFGLTDFGYDVVSKMNNLNMVVDVSHISDSAFWDVDKASALPYIASHSNAREVCSAKRNLTDAQIKRIADRGGIIGINFYPPFVNNSDFATSDDIIRHIDYIINLTNDNYVGLGCDFDGIDVTPMDITNISDMNVFRMKLEQKYSTTTVEKILYSNFHGFFCEILK